MQRFWEIDFVRGIAIIMMVGFHLLFDLDYFSVASVPLQAGFWFWFARATASIFIFLVGVSLAISCSRSRASGLDKKERIKKFTLRGAKIFALGLAISAITWLIFPKEFIIFGILHFIGLSIILSQPFLEWKWKALVLGALAIIAGIALQSLRFGSGWLLWLGFAPSGFLTFDYFPLMPWFGLVLVGIFAGNMLYPKAKRRIAVVELGKNWFAEKFCWLGRHSLAIYFVHQPVLIAGILLLNGI